MGYLLHLAAILSCLITVGSIQVFNIRAFFSLFGIFKQDVRVSKVMADKTLLLRPQFGIDLINDLFFYFLPQARQMVTIAAPFEGH